VFTKKTLNKQQKQTCVTVIPTWCHKWLVQWQYLPADTLCYRECVTLAPIVGGSYYYESKHHNQNFKQQASHKCKHCRRESIILQHVICLAIKTTKFNLL